MDPRTPVIVGVGQVTNRRERIIDPMTLMEEAVSAANSQAGGRALEHVGSVQVLSVVSKRYASSAATLAANLGLADGERLSTTVGGSTPQWLICEACDRIVRGELDAVLIAGAEALDSARRASKEGKPFGRVDHDAPGPDVMIGDDRSPVNDAEIRARLVAPASIYPMFEQVLAHRAGRTLDSQRAWLGEVMAPFTRVAASNPEHAWFPDERTPADISDVSPDNRMVAEPYTKNLNSILQVDMGAAVIVMSVSAAESAGVPRDRWVFPWSGAKCDDVFITAERPDLGRAAGLETAARASFEAAGIGIDDVRYVDIYSCFPSAVQIGAAALGLDVFDPRGLTVTGGLAAFGGPGNNYMTHSIATLVSRLRDDPKAIGIVTGVSWYMSKHSIGVYSATPPPNGWRYADTKDEQARIDATAIEVAGDGEGDAIVDAFTIEHDRDAGPRSAPVYATLADGRRVVAMPADVTLPAQLSGRSLVGEKVRVLAGEGSTVYEPL
jgi:acetyl-CoA C-acetyltransferase